MTDSTLTGKGIEGVTNAFATISVQADNVTVTTTGGKLVATGTQQHILGVDASNKGAAFVLDSELVYADDGIVGADVAENSITVRDDYAAQVNQEGFLYEVNEQNNQLIDLTGNAVAYNTRTNVYYDDLMVAIMDAQAGDTVRPIVDIETNIVTVFDGVTLDLNGYTLTTRYFTAYGDVIDGQVGGYGLIKAQRAHAASEQSYLPVYDTAAGGYRFYKYELVNKGYRVSGTTITFGIHLALENPDGYSVIANTSESDLDEHLQLHAHIGWTGLGDEVDYVFTSNTIIGYAGAAANDFATIGSTKKAVTLTIRGLNVLSTAGSRIYMNAAITTSTNMNTMEKQGCEYVIS